MRSFTPEQQILIETNAAGTFILPRVAVAADAGAGKTSVLVERVRRFKTDRRVLCVSFTEKSKADLEERLSEFLHVEVYTIHGFCGRIVSEFGARVGLSPVFRILDQDESDELFYRAFEKVYRRIPPQNVSHTADRFFELCLKAKTLAKADRAAEIVDLSGAGDTDTFVAAVLDQYQVEKKNLRGIEFSDLEIFALQLLRNRAVFEAVRTRYAHVFVDEFQDTSDLQCELVQLLTGSTGPLFVVGDEKQSIYRFRGADVDVFKAFVSTLPERRRLSTNFRSHKEIIDAVNSVCEPIIDQYVGMTAGRDLARSKLTSSFGTLSRVARVTSDDDLSGVLATIRKLQQSGVSVQDMVLLLPRIRGNDALLAGLTQAGISVVTSSSSSSSGDANLLALLNLWVWACEPWQLLRAAQVLCDFGDADRIRSTFKNELSTIKLNRGDTKPKSCEQLLQNLEEQFHLSEKFGSTFEQFRLFVLKHQTEGISPFVLARRMDQMLMHGLAIDGFTLVPPPSYVESTQLLGDQQASQALRVMTIHASKGLEFPVVLLCDLKKRRGRGNTVLGFKNRIFLAARDEDGEIDKENEDYKHALVSEQMAEEAERARLLYVAMTRAEEALYLIDRPDVILEPGKKPKPPEVSWSQWVKDAKLNTVRAEELEVNSRQNPNLDLIARSPLASLSAALELLPPVYKRARIGVSELVKGSEVQASQKPKAAVKQNDPRAFGTQLHSLIERKDWVALDTVAAASQLDLSRFHEWRASKEGAIVFGSSAKPEFAFDWKTEHGVVVGRVDCLVEVGDEVWIIDYKVVQSYGPNDASQLSERYREPMMWYSRAVKKMTPSKRVRAFLVDVLASTGRVWIEIPVIIN